MRVCVCAVRVCVSAPCCVSDSVVRVCVCERVCVCVCTTERVMRPVLCK